VETKQIEALPHQLATLQALTEYKNVAMIGGVGSGKTFTLALFLLTEVKRAMEQGDTSTGIITAMSYGQLRRSVLTEVFKCMTEWGIDFQYNQQQSLLTLGGVKKFFCVSAEKGSVDRVRGINAGSIAIDEGCYISQESYSTLMGRVRDRAGSGRCLITSSPAGFNWVYDMFVGEKHDPVNYKLIKASTKDNTYISEDFYDRMAENLDTKGIKQELEGEFLSVKSGQVYYCFDRTRNIKQCKNPGFGIIACDFNVDPLTAVIAYYQNGTFYVFDEIFLQGGSDTYLLAAELKKRGYANWKLVADSTYSNRSTSGKSNKVILQNEGFECLPVKNPLVIDRVQNMNRLLAQSRVIIDPTCKKLIRDLEQVVWRPNGSLDQVTNKELTHISDSLGYLLHKFAPIKSKNEIGIISQER